jgi:hypothetical protein
MKVGNHVLCGNILQLPQRRGIQNLVAQRLPASDTVCVRARWPVCARFRNPGSP